MGFSRQEHGSGLPFPSPLITLEYYFFSSDRAVTLTFQISQVVPSWLLLNSLIVIISTSRFILYTSLNYSISERELYYHIYVYIFKTLENIWFTLGRKTSVAQYWNYLNPVLTSKSNEGFFNSFLKFWPQIEHTLNWWVPIAFSQWWPTSLILEQSLQKTQCLHYSLPITFQTVCL